MTEKSTGGTLSLCDHLLKCITHFSGFVLVYFFNPIFFRFVLIIFKFYNKNIYFKANGMY